MKKSPVKDEAQIGLFIRCSAINKFLSFLLLILALLPPKIKMEERKLPENQQVEITDIPIKIKAP